MRGHLFYFSAIKWELPKHKGLLSNIYWKFMPTEKNISVLSVIFADICKQTTDTNIYNDINQSKVWWRITCKV